MTRIFSIVLLLLSVTFPTAAADSTNAMTGEPTNAKQAAEAAKPKNKLTDAERAANDERKKAMPPAAAAWEKVLEGNLGGFYYPPYIRAKLAGEETAWDYVADVPGLPRALIIGDSVSRGYTLPVRHALAGRVNVHRAPENCGPTDRALQKLDVWLGDGHWDVIHFNFGIHDRGKSEDAYRTNLDQVVERLQKTGAKLIWARTTPAPDGPNAENFTAEKCDKLNRVADDVMHRHDIPIDDLYNEVLPRQKELQQTNNVHFTDAGYEVLGQKVAGTILSSLAADKK